VFGGTFDPIHLGHLILAEQCREQARLEQVWFVPSARPPHKLDQHQTPFDRRVEMIELAIAGHAGFRVEPLERDRPGPSFTADTLETLRSTHPEADLHWVLGADCLPDLPGWHEPRRIVSQAGLLVVARPNWEIWPVERLRAALGLNPDEPLRMEVIESPLIDIASRDIRRRVEQGRSIRYLVPRAVECYVDAHRLYRPTP
jgi:nicotinate-nucleotide adenylyltransferase